MAKLKTIVLESILAAGILLAPSSNLYAGTIRVINDTENKEGIDKFTQKISNKFKAETKSYDFNRKTNYFTEISCDPGNKRPEIWAYLAGEFKKDIEKSALWVYLDKTPTNPKSFEMPNYVIDINLLRSLYRSDESMGRFIKMLNSYGYRAHIEDSLHLNGNGNPVESAVIRMYSKKDKKDLFKEIKPLVPWEMVSESDIYTIPEFKNEMKRRKEDLPRLKKFIKQNPVKKK